VLSDTSVESVTKGVLGDAEAAVRGGPRNDVTRVAHEAHSNMARDGKDRDDEA
jgi:hypothetical protein